jgi:hypothetical protein
MANLHPVVGFHEEEEEIEEREDLSDSVIQLCIHTRVIFLIIV